MTAQVILHPALAEQLTRRIEDAHSEVALCAVNVRQAQALLEQRTGELELAREELAALEAQQLVWCGTCETHHQPLRGPCPGPEPCPACGYRPCLPGCFERGDDA